MKLKDKKIRIIAFTSTTNEHGFNTEEWRPIHSGRLWAYYRQLSGSEFYASRNGERGGRGCFHSQS